MRITRIFRQLLLFALMCAAGVATSAERVLDHATLQRLSTLAPDAPFTLDAFPAGPTRTASFRLKRVPIYAPDAHLYLIGAGGTRREIPRSTRVFLRGYAADGSARVAMVLEADGSFVEGNGEGAEGAFALDARMDASSKQLTFSLRDRSNPPCPRRMRSSSAAATKKSISTRMLPAISPRSCRKRLRLRPLLRRRAQPRVSVLRRSPSTATACSCRACSPTTRPRRRTGSPACSTP